MHYQEVKEKLLQHLIENGYLQMGKDAVYKIFDGSYILIKPRKHIISSTQFFVDYGILYQYDGKQKKPAKTSDCHFAGEFSNVANWKTGELNKEDYKVWDTEPIDLAEILETIGNIILPYIDMVSKLSYIQQNYPLNNHQKRGNATSLANHNYLCGLINLN